MPHASAISFSDVRTPDAAKTPAAASRISSRRDRSSDSNAGLVTFTRLRVELPGRARYELVDAHALGQTDHERDGLTEHLGRRRSGTGDEHRGVGVGNLAVDHDAVQGEPFGLE